MSKFISGVVKTDKGEAIDYEEEVSQYLQEFLKLNQSLIHLDLSSCGLTHQVILNLVAMIRQSPSLVGVHFSGNPELNTANV